MPPVPVGGNDKGGRACLDDNDGEEAGFSVLFANRQATVVGPNSSGTPSLKTSGNTGLTPGPILVSDGRNKLASLCMGARRLVVPLYHFCRSFVVNILSAAAARKVEVAAAQ